MAECAVGARKLRAFTLIEFLIVVLVLSVLMAIALPLYLGAISDAQVKACRANMQTIADADQAYKTEMSPHQYTTAISDLQANLGLIPICPTGGSYSLVVSDGTNTSNGQAVPAGGLIVSCTGASTGTAHGTFAPGVDTN